MQTDRKKLIRAMTLLIKGADKKNPVLGCVELVADNDVLSLRTTDMQSDMVAHLLGQGNLARTIVDAAELLKTLKMLSGDMVDLVYTADRLALSDSASETTITPHYDLFPKPIPSNGGNIAWTVPSIWDAKELYTAISFVLPAVSVDETRPHINTLAIQQHRVVCTDGHRLHTATISDNTFAADILISSRAANMLSHMLKKEKHEVKVSLHKEKEIIQFEAGSFRLSTERVDAQFPPVDQVLPKKDVICTVEADRLLGVLDRFRGLDRFTGIECAWRDGTSIGIIVRTGNDELRTTLELASPYHGIQFASGYNIRYLTAAVKNSRGCMCELTIRGPLDPLRIDIGGQIAIVMPKKL